jgi:hypothetical protein
MSVVEQVLLGAADVTAGFSLYGDFGELTAHRVMLDAVIKAWAASLTDEDLNHSLRYTNTNPSHQCRRVNGLHRFETSLRG